MTPLKQRFKEAIGDYDEDSVRFGKQGIAIACEEITIEIMGEVLDWCGHNEYFYNAKHKKWEDSNEEVWLTTPELIQKFLKSKMG